MASTVLTRTPSSNGSQRIMTFSAWIKLDITTSNAFFSTGSSGSALFSLYFTNASKLQMEYYNGSTNYYLRTNRLFRDVNAWYHIVMVLDTTQATEANRMRIYVNGTEETSFDANQYPTKDFDVQYINSTSYSNKVGNNNGANFFTGQLAHVHYVDGTAYTPSTFGETDTTTGIWKPKTAPTVTHGTNGFFLKFDNLANMGLDSSGQSNNLTTSGPIIQNKDTPSNVFCTINPLDNYYGGGTLSNGNTKIQTGGSNIESYTLSTLGASSGKYYCEMKLINSTSSYKTRFGIAYEPTNSTSDWLGKRAVGYSLRQDGNATNNNSTISGTFASYTSGDIISMAIDLDNSKLYFRKNNDAWMNSGNPTSGSTGTGAISITPNKTYLIGIGDETGGYSVCELNFGNGYFGTTAVSSAGANASGNGIFEYDVPTGYTALSTKGLNL